jgi:hypothetical protein
MWHLSLIRCSCCSSCWPCFSWRLKLWAINVSHWFSHKLVESFLTFLRSLLQLGFDFNQGAVWYMSLLKGAVKVRLPKERKGGSRNKEVYCTEGTAALPTLPPYKKYLLMCGALAVNVALDEQAVGTNTCRGLLILLHSLPVRDGSVRGPLRQEVVLSSRSHQNFHLSSLVACYKISILTKELHSFC